MKFRDYRFLNITDLFLDRQQEDASVELVYQCGSGDVISTATTSS